MVFKNTVAEAIVDVKTDTRKYERGMRGVKGSLSGLGKLAAAAFATKKIFDFGKASIQIASEFTEVRNRFKVVFREVGDEAELAADKIAKNFDLAAGTTRKMLADTGDLLTGLGFTRKEALKMSVAIGKLAGDVASFKDIEGGAADVAFMMTKAMIGQTKSVRNQLKYSVALDAEHNKRVKALMKEQGLDKKKARALDVYTQLIKAAKNADGDYDNTKMQFANRQRALTQAQIDFKEAIGKVGIGIIEASGAMDFMMGSLKRLTTSLNGFLESGKWIEWSLAIGNTVKHVVATWKLGFDAMKIILDASFKNFIEVTNTWGKKIGRAIANMVHGTDFDIGEFQSEGIIGMEEVMKDLDEIERKYQEANKKRSEETKKRAAELAKLQNEKLAWNDELLKKELAAENKKNIARFSNAEGVLKLAQEAAMVGSGGVAQANIGVNKGQVAPQKNAVNDVAVATAQTGKTLDNILLEVKESNTILTAIGRGLSSSSGAIFA